MNKAQSLKGRKFKERTKSSQMSKSFPSASIGSTQEEIEKKAQEKYMALLIYVDIYHVYYNTKVIQLDFW